MKRHFRYVLVIMIIIGIGATNFGCRYKAITGGYEHDFQVIGDVEASLKVSSMAGFQTKFIVKDNKIYKSIALADVVNTAKIRSSSFDLLFIGEDGLSSKIKGDDLTGCNLVYSEKYDWELFNEFHPISSQVKNLRSIVVISTAIDDDKNAVGINDDNGYRSTTAGNLFLNGYTEARIFEGRSELNGKEVTVYTTHQQIMPEALLSYEKEVGVFSSDGSVKFDKKNSDSFFEITKTGIDYSAADGTKVSDVTGIIADPPRVSITDVCSDAVYLLDKENNVMILELDGLGWQMLEKAKKGSYAPYLSSLEAQPALSVYPPISPAGLAAMITGTTPDINGITGRGIMDFKGEDIFSKAQKLGKTVAYIEGDTKMLNTSVEPILSVNEGAQDSVVFKNTQKAIAEQKQLIFSHFHSIDDDATTYGPYSEESLEQIKLVDDMVKQLVEGFNGTVIITADHGLHSIGNAGTHGIICSEDMIVPYIIIKN
ncbi:MAG: alkaline phosphatase family protein [Acetobacterium sp.]